MTKLFSLILLFTYPTYASEEAVKSNLQKALHKQFKIEEKAKQIEKQLPELELHTCFGIYNIIQKRQIKWKMSPTKSLTIGDKFANIVFAF